jgi:hypothetical protein
MEFLRHSCTPLDSHAGFIYSQASWRFCIVNAKTAGATALLLFSAAFLFHKLFVDALYMLWPTSAL